LIEVHGRPFIFYQLEWLARHGVRDVVVSIGYRGGLISQAVGDGRTFGLSVNYADEGETLRGTGGALRMIADLGLLAPSFFLLYGDSYLPIDLLPVWRTSDGGRFPTMTVLRNSGRWDRSNVIFRDNRLVLYDKHAMDPAARAMDYIDYGLSVLNRHTIMEEFAPGETADIARLFTKLSRQGVLRGHEIFERFYEIGSPQGLDDFTAYIAGGRT
jgi:NDP-sugar pyrophosphorylase family protein